MQKIVRRRLRLVFGATITGAVAIAHSQTPVPSKPTASSTALEEIVVTAERRIENLQAAPVSITAINADELAARNITTVDDALRSVPGVALQGNANGAGIYVRGIGSGQDQAFGSPAVNLNFDGIYQQQPNIPLSSMYDIERIEVLRGPQGTLYGRNATAGSINIITANPSNQSEAAGSIGIGNYGLKRTEAMINVPMSDAVAVRASMVTERHDGYLRPSGYNDADNTGGRFKLSLKPNRDLSVLLAAEYLHIGGVGNGAVDPLATHPGNPWASNAPAGLIDLKAWRVYGQLDWDLSFGTLSVLPAHQKFNNYVNNVLIVPATTSTAQTILERQDTLEVRLASPARSFLKWVAGLYFLDSKDDTPPNTVSRTTLPATPSSFPWFAGNKTTSSAAFGQATYPVSDRIRLTGGARYTQDKKTVYDLITQTTSTSFNGSWNSSTYKAGVEADLARESMVYANVSTGFKAGGIDQGFNRYAPEKLTAYTAGSKNRFLGDSLQINAEAFYYDYKDFQAQYGYRCQNAAACPVVATFANTIVNAGKATLYGAEMEAVARVTSADRVDASAAYNHTLFDSLIIHPGTANNNPAGCATTWTCTVQADQILTNQALANAPRWTFSLGYEHVWALPSGADITFRADTHSYTSYWTLYRRPPQVPVEAFQKAYVKTNASVAYDAPLNKWSLRLWVKNIENKAVVSGAVVNNLFLQPPRTFGATLAARF